MAENHAYAGVEPKWRWPPAIGPQVVVCDPPAGPEERGRRKRIGFWFDLDFVNMPAGASKDLLPGRQVKKIVCHGSLIGETAGALDGWRTNIAFGRMVIVDLKDVCYVDTDGWDALLRFRFGAKLENVCVEVLNLAPRLLQLTSSAGLQNCYLS